VAKKAKINKSKMIRDYKIANPEAGPSAISKALTKKGMPISEGFVSTVLSQAGMTDKNAPVHSKSGKTLRDEIGKTVHDPSEPSVSKKDLLAVIHLADQMGGIEPLKDAIAIIEQLNKLNVKL
jgi:hypothetical protein